MVKMEYKIVSTIQGPAVIGEDEVLFFNQHGQLLDYADSDPEFVLKAKQFISDGIVTTANNLAKSMFEPVIGGDLTQDLYGYVNAMRFISEFEHRFLPSVNKN
jgi:hypothetical protein